MRWRVAKKVVRGVTPWPVRAKTFNAAMELLWRRLRRERQRVIANHFAAKGMLVPGPGSVAQGGAGASSACPSDPDRA